MASPEIVDTQEEAAAQERPPLIVRRPLEAFLDSEGLGSGPIEAERVGEGHSNETFRIDRGGESFVLRRPPRPPLPPSAHDVLREARMLAAIQDQPVRTPRVLASSDDESIIGVPFYVMEFLDGHVITSELPAEFDPPEERRRIGDELIDSMAEMHAVDWRACGLDTFAKHTGYLERQLKRFNGLWEYNKTRELPIVQEVADWLASNMPETAETTIVHGDFRLGNTMYAKQAPARLIAIFDWEMCTLGDPMADVGYLTVTWPEPEDEETTSFSSLTAVTRRGGFHTRDELIARYSEQSGRSVADLRWYQALALWKAVVFMEGNYKRSLAGSTDDPYLKLFDKGVPALAEAAREVTRQPAPDA